VHKYIAIFFLLVLFGCNNSHHREVMVNKTVKVFSDNYHDQAENYTFKWQAPIGPNNKKIIFDMKNDMLIFTPKIVGNYEVNLSIEDISEEIVAKEIFYFKAIPETIEVSIVDPNIKSPTTPIVETTKLEQKVANKTERRPAKKQQSTKKSRYKKVPHKSKAVHSKFSIQISAWPSLEEARKHQLELIDEGFDAYTQRFYFKKKDEVWYRVRVGDFSSMNKTLKIKKQIESSTGISTWIDILSSK